MPRYLDYSYTNDTAVKLKVLEFAVESLSLSRKQALIEIGIPEDVVDNLMEERLAEDLVEDPQTRKTLGEEVIKGYLNA